MLSLAPSERVTEARVRAYLDHLRPGLTRRGLWNYLKHLYDALRLMIPQRDWSWLRTVVTRIERDLVPASKHAAVVSAERLVDLGLRLMDRAEADPSALRRTDRLIYRDGLLIALLAHRALRRRTLALMEVDKNLLSTSDGYLLVFGPADVKNRQPLEYTLPEILVPYMDRYLTQIRPLIPGANRHKGLWASAKGCPLNGDALNLAVKRHTEAEFGRAVHLHLFRDCAATTIAIHDPRHVRVARDLLGHSRLETTDRYYNQARAIEASRQYADHILAMRERLGREDRPRDKER